VRKKLTRPKLLPFVAQLSPCRIGMEACEGAHYWVREMRKLGHDVRLISPQFVTPYRKSHKNDPNDAAAICEAVGEFPDGTLIRYVGVVIARRRAWCFSRWKMRRDSSMLSCGRRWCAATPCWPKRRAS
jgi:transposase